MQSWEDRQLRQLRPAWPGWDIWYVRYATVRQGVWCAKPKGTPVATIHASSPEQLTEKIRQAR